jgi:hypothetical protein
MEKTCIEINLLENMIRCCLASPVLRGQSLACRAVTYLPRERRLALAAELGMSLYIGQNVTIPDHINEAFRAAMQRRESIVREAVAAGFDINDLVLQTVVPWPGRPVQWRLVTKDGQRIADGTDWEMVL